MLTTCACACACAYVHLQGCRPAHTQHTAQACFHAFARDAMPWTGHRSNQGRVLPRTEGRNGRRLIRRHWVGPSRRSERGGDPRGSDSRGSAKRRACATLFCGMRRSSTYSGSGDLRASSGAGPSESLAAPFDLTGARSWSASSLVLGCFLPRKDKAAWMTQAMYLPMSFWPPEDQLLHYACTDEPQSSGEPAAEKARERAGTREEETEHNAAPACKVPSCEVLLVAKVPAPPRPCAPGGDSRPLAPPHPPPHPSATALCSHPLLPRRVWRDQPHERQ
jgi:hypothetical protein